MSHVLFRHPPQPTLLQQLAKSLLEQNHHLTRAVRLWVWLRWLYGDKGYTTLPCRFTYADWRQAFFSDTHRDEKREDVFSHQDPNCACTKTTSQWLYELDISLFCHFPSILNKRIKRKSLPEIAKVVRSNPSYCFG